MERANRISANNWALNLRSNGVSAQPQKEASGMRQVKTPGSANGMHKTLSQKSPTSPNAKPVTERQVSLSSPNAPAALTDEETLARIVKGLFSKFAHERHRAFGDARKAALSASSPDMKRALYWTIHYFLAPSINNANCMKLGVYDQQVRRCLKAVGAPENLVKGTETYRNLPMTAPAEVLDQIYEPLLDWVKLPYNASQLHGEQSSESTAEGYAVFMREMCGRERYEGLDWKLSTDQLVNVEPSLNLPPRSPEIEKALDLLKP